VWADLGAAIFARTDSSKQILHFVQDDSSEVILSASEESVCGNLAQNLLG